MNPHISARSSRRSAVAGNPRAGFTLVELLVVIAIIAMLVGLLLPAVQMAREAGRRTVCMNNQQQLAKGIVNYVTAKGVFPPSFSVQPGTGPLTTSATPAVSVGWVPLILPYIEQNQYYVLFQNNTLSSLLPPAGKGGEISFLSCPTRNPTNSPFPLSYVVNCGMKDQTPGNVVANPTAFPMLDYQANGVFFDAFTPTAYPAVPAITATPPTDLTYFVQHDGQSNTLMLSENLDALDWFGLPAPMPPAQPPPYGSAPPQLPSVWTGSPGDSWWNGFTWAIPTGFIPPSATAVPVADYGNGGNPPTNTTLNKNAGSMPTQDAINGRPSSLHPGGFIVTMCDGHSTFMSEDIEYRVYCLLMAPDSANARVPTAGLPSPNVTFTPSPANWYVNPGLFPAIPGAPTTPATTLRPFSATDLK